MNKYSSILSFILGIGIGITGSCYYFKNKYEQIANEEIESVKAAFSLAKEGETVIETSRVSEKPDLATEFNKAKDIAEKSGYVNYSDITKPSGTKKVKTIVQPAAEMKPYVIPPEEFSMNEEDGYTEVSLEFYDEDEVLADENDEIVDAANTVGEDFAEHFGEYEDDSVFIRDDRNKIDYEILKVDGSYWDRIKSKPHRVKVED